MAHLLGFSAFVRLLDTGPVFSHLSPALFLLQFFPRIFPLGWENINIIQHYQPNKKPLKRSNSNG